jgi:hypothetical protein
MLPAVTLPPLWLTTLDIVLAPPQNEISYAAWCNIGGCLRQGKSGPNFAPALHWGDKITMTPDDFADALH